MKLAIRIFALSIVFVGVAAASVSSHSHAAMEQPSHQAATSANPIPTCAPGLPGCPNTPGN